MQEPFNFTLDDLQFLAQQEEPPVEELLITTEIPEPTESLVAFTIADFDAKKLSAEDANAYAYYDAQYSEYYNLPTLDADYDWANSVIDTDTSNGSCSTGLSDDSIPDTTTMNPAELNSLLGDNKELPSTPVTPSKKGTGRKRTYNEEDYKEENARFTLDQNDPISNSPNGKVKKSRRSYCPPDKECSQCINFREFAKIGKRCTHKCYFRKYVKNNKW